MLFCILSESRYRLRRDWKLGSMQDFYIVLISLFRTFLMLSQSSILFTCTTYCEHIQPVSEKTDYHIRIEVVIPA